MKTKTLLTVILAIILVSCAPASISTPTETPAPTATITLTPVPPTPTVTLTVTPMPAEPLEKQAITIEWIEKFILASNMKGLSVNAPDILKDLHFVEKTDVNGNKYNIAISGDTYLPITYEMKNGQAIARELGLGELARKQGLEVGLVMSLFNMSKSENIESDFNTIYFSDVFMGSPWGERFYFFPNENKIDVEKLSTAIQKSNLLYPNHAIKAENIIWGKYDFLPSWLLKGDYSKEQLQQFMVTYIEKIIPAGKGKISKWVFVSEPFGSGDNPPQSFWQEKLGANAQDTEWVKIAFRTANKADPNAQLILCDFGIEIPNSWLNNQHPEKADKIFNLAKELHDEGLPVEIGFQMHMIGNDTTTSDRIKIQVESFKKNIKRYKDVGINVSIVEWDVNMEQVSGTQEQKMKLQEDIYRAFLVAALESGITDINFFQSSDEQSWLGLNALATLRHDGKEKPAWFAVFNVIANFAK